MEKKSRNRELASTIMAETLRLLKDRGGELRSAEIETSIGERVALDEWALHEYPNGGVRWMSVLHFYSIDLVKAGYIRKNKGRWFLTDEGRTAVDTMDKEQLFDTAHRAYLEWDKARRDIENENACIDDDGGRGGITYQDIKDKSDEDIMQYIQSRTPYEFQDLVAALFRSMGYYTPFIAPKGKDGGIDIIAYSDPLGATKPTLKVQVKHYNMDNPVTVDVIRSIVGVSKDGIAIVVTSGRFAEAAKKEARQYNVRIIDGYEFADLWIRYYGKMSEEDKTLMPIEPLYFIKRAEQ